MQTQYLNRGISISPVRVIPTSLLLAIALFFSGCKSATGASDIMYEVSGSGRADITYAIEGSTNQVSNTILPWTRSFSADRGDFLYVSAQKDGTASTCVFARIYKRGEVVQSGSGCGAFAIATASATN